MTPVKKLLCALYVLLAIAAVSCSKGTQSDDCEQCRPMPADKVISLKIGNQEKAFNVWHSDNRNGDDDFCLADAKGNTPTADLHTVLETYHIPGSFARNSVVAVSLFVDKNLYREQIKDISKESIKGLFVYYENGDKLLVSVFEATGSGFSEIKELAAETPYITSNNLAAFSKALMNAGHKSVTTILLSDNDKNIERPKSKDQFSFKLTTFLRKGLAYRPTGGFENREHNYYGSCLVPCLPGGSLSCAKRPFWTCKGLTDCGKVALDSWNSYTPGNDPRDVTLYAFRDNFMTQSAIGTHFVEDFYYIGSVIKDNLNADIAAQSFATIDGIVLPVIDKLLNTPESDEVIFGTSEKDQLITYVDNVSALSDDSMFLEMMDEIKYNIEYAAGKTVKAVHDELLAN